MEVIYDGQANYLGFKTEEGKIESVVVLPEDDYTKLKNAFQELNSNLKQEKSKVLLLMVENATAKAILETNEKMCEDLSNTQKELTDEKVKCGEYRGQIKGLKEQVDSLEKQLAEERTKIEELNRNQGRLEEQRDKCKYAWFVKGIWATLTMELKKGKWKIALDAEVLSVINNVIQNNPKVFKAVPTIKTLDKVLAILAIADKSDQT